MLAQRMNDHEHYLGNINVKRDGVQQQWVEHEVVEYAKCMSDPSYFARKYVKIISLDEGLVNFDLYPYQEQMFNHFNDNRFSIVLACRQSGKSISSVVYLLWYAIFHPEKTIAVLANKGATAREMLQRVTLALEHLPFFLQPGVVPLTKVVSNSLIILELLRQQLLVVLFVVCLSTYFFLTSLLLLKEQVSSILRRIQ